MALISCAFNSSVLQKSVQFNAIIPSGKESKARVLYLLHGLSDDYTAWGRYTAIERYANESGLVVIMPDGGKSFYTDMAAGDAYYTFFIHELYPYIQSLFKVSTKREDTFIAGLSMGGYGALRMALLHPEKFSAAGSLSGCVDVCHRLAHDPRWKQAKASVFGAERNPEGTELDLFHLIKTYRSPLPLRIYLGCGTEDFLYQDNLKLEKELSLSSIPYQFSASAGIHDWKYWDAEVQKTIRFLLNPAIRLE